MKIKLNFLFTLLFFIPILGKTQTFTAFWSDSTQIAICDTSYNINIFPGGTFYTSNTYANFVYTGTNILGQNIFAQIIWDDGDTTHYTGTAVSPTSAIIWNTPIQHTYQQDGIYSVQIILDDSLGNTISASVDAIMGACVHPVPHIVNVDCNNDGINDYTIDTIFLMLQSNGITQSGSPTSYSNLFGSFGNNGGLTPGNYQYVVDPSWLSLNNYNVVSITPDSAYFGFNSPTDTIVITLSCDSSLLDTNCVAGVVFCDANNNGVFDSTELAIPNAPISLVLSDGSLYLTTSDFVGSYNFSYLNPNQLTGDIFVHYDWLDSMGYYYSPFNTITPNNNSCVNNNISNIPIICDTNSLSVGCVTGYAYCDVNSNGILDSNEIVLNNVPVQLSGIGGLITVYSDSLGYFSYTGWQLSAGLVFISIDQTWLTNNGYSNIFSGTTITNLNCANSNTVYLGINCTNTNNCADLWSSVTPWIGYYQNTINSIYLSYGNYGQLSTGNYTITLDYPTGVTPVLSSINNSNYTITGNTITWTLTSLNSYFYYSDIIYFNTPAGIPDSTFHVFSSTISSATTDCSASNNYSTLGMYVGVSYDPNDKSVNKPLIVDPTIQDEYTYVVRFQNTGTAPAQDVYILDSLTTNLDWTTFELLEATHNVQLVNMGNGIMKFDFPQIWLPDSTHNEPASHGHVVFKIKELASLGEGDVIENTAYIYFDQNAPIITNTTKNINTVGLGIKNTEQLGFNLYPNPVNSELNIVSDQNIETINVIDLSGKVTMTLTGGGQLTQIDVSGLSQGMYTIQIISDTKSGSTLFIKR